MTRLTVLVSGSGTNLQAILDACADGTIDGRVVHVVSNRKKAFGLTRAERAGVPTTVHRLKPYRDASAPDGEARRAYDRDLADLVAATEPDLVILAGWMHVLSPAFLDRFGDRVINLHPALPGELPGINAIERAWKEAQAGRRTATGIMVHRVVPEIDAGPVLGTTVVPIEPGEPLDALAARVHAAEHRLLVQVIAEQCRAKPAPTINR